MLTRADYPALQRCKGSYRPITKWPVQLPSVHKLISNFREVFLESFNPLRGKGLRQN